MPCRFEDHPTAPLTPAHSLVAIDRNRWSRSIGIGGRNQSEQVVAISRNAHAGERVHVYLDVSGSMDAVKGPLYRAILDCETQVYRTVHLFSTKIADISLDELRRGVCKSTGGTDIACVASHMQSNHIRRALIVTDGWVGKPHGCHRDTLSAARLAVAFFGPTANPGDLAEVADFSVTLNVEP